MILLRNVYNTTYQLGYRFYKAPLWDWTY